MRGGRRPAAPSPAPDPGETVTVAAGYSGTPLPKKLGLKDGQRAAFLGLPADLHWLTESVGFTFLAEADRLQRGAGPLDVIHAFFTRAADLAKALPHLMATIEPDGMIWISWPKRSSGRSTDITEDTIREHALPIGLVDIKVCAVDETWSGLKLVIRKELRHKRTDKTAPA